jgi:hypothetical protein
MVRTPLQGHHKRVKRFFLRSAILVALAALVAPAVFGEQLKPETVAGFDRYVRLSEQGMAGEEQSAEFLKIDSLPAAEAGAVRAKLKNGEVVIEHLETRENGRPIAVPNGLIHHWIGTVFVPGASLTQTVAFLQDYNNQTRYYAPDVERSRLMAKNGNEFKVFLRLRKHKVVTAVLDTNYDVTYRSLGADRAVCRSVSTRIAEVANPGEKNESEKPVGNDSGFMWRLNSYWRFEQRDGGTYVQLEAISLTRDIPAGLSWLVAPFVNSIPRESLEFTLQRTREGLMRNK